MEVHQILGICNILLEGVDTVLFSWIAFNQPICFAFRKKNIHQVVYIKHEELTSVLKHPPFHSYIKPKNKVNEHTLLYMFTLNN